MGWSKEGSYAKLKYPSAVITRDTRVTTHVSDTARGRVTLFAIFCARTGGGAAFQPLAEGAPATLRISRFRRTYAERRRDVYCIIHGIVREITLPRFLIRTRRVGPRSSSRCLGNIVMGLVALLGV